MAKSPRDINLLDDVIKGKKKLPFSIKARDLNRDYNWFTKRILQRDASNDIGLSKEADRNLLWFRKRKSGGR